MATESSIQTNSVPWQLRQLGKNLSEWIQLQLAEEPEPESPPPAFEFPAWIGQVLFWCLVTGAIVWVAWFIVKSIDQAVKKRQRQPQGRPAVELVKAPEVHSAAGWVQRARQFEQEGNWREACRALYLATLQLLHDRGWIAHQFSRTDGEYLQVLQTLPQPRPIQVLIRTHERSLFGGEPLSADNWQRCRQAYEEIAKR